MKYIEMRYEYDGVYVYKCFSCRNEWAARWGIWNYCPSCGIKIEQYKKEFGKRTSRILDAYNRRFPNNKAYDLSDVRGGPSKFHFPESIKSVSIIVVETLECCYDFESEEIETEVEKKILRKYTNNPPYHEEKLKDSLYRTVETELAYYKLKYQDILEKNKHRSVFDECGSVLIDFKIKIEIEKTNSKV